MLNTFGINTIGPTLLLRKPSNHHLSLPTNAVPLPPPRGVSPVSLDKSVIIVTQIAISLRNPILHYGPTFLGFGTRNIDEKHRKVRQANFDVPNMLT